MGTSLGRYMENVGAGKPLDVLQGAKTLDTAIDTAAEKNKKRAARELELSARTGLPLDVVSRNLEQIETEAKKADFDPIRFQQKNPLTASWLAKSPNHMALADDDDKYRLTTLEDAIRPLAEFTGLGEFGKAVGVAGAMGPSGIGHGLEALGETLRGNPNLPGASVLLTDIGQAFRKGAANATEGVTPRVSDYSAVETAGDLRDYLAYQLGQGIGSMAGITVATVAGGPVAGLGVGGAMAFGDVREELAELDPEQSSGVRNALALALAVPIAALDQITPGQLAGKLLTRGMAKGVITEAAKHGLTRRVATEVLKSAAQEGGTEVAQELVQYLGTRAGTGTAVSGGELANRAINAGIGGAMGGGFFGASSAAIQALDDVSKDAAMAKVAPEVLEEAVAHLTSDGPLANVYAPVETWTTFYQEQGLDPAVEAERVIGSREAYEDALRTGEDLVIPSAQYAVRVPTEHKQFWKNELRVSPLATSAREAGEAVQATDTEATADGETDSEAQGATVADDVAAQLEGAGYDPETAATYAKLYDAAFRTLGQRMGMDPLALYQQYRLKIEGEQKATPIGQKLSLEEITKRALDVRDRLAEQNLERSGMQAADVYSLPDTERDPNAKTESGEFVYARTAGGTMRSNLAKVSTDGLIDELVRIHEAQELTSRDAVPTSHEIGGSILPFVGYQRPSSIKALGILAARKKSLAKVEAELARRGVSQDAVNEMFTTRMMGSDAEEFSFEQSRELSIPEMMIRTMNIFAEVARREPEDPNAPPKIVQTHMIWSKAAEDQNLSDGLRTYARNKAESMEQEARNALANFYASHGYNQDVSQTETPEFKRWFGDSKVVDENGDPLVVYHGTQNKAFTEFRVGYAPGWGAGIYFTDNAEQAAEEFGFGGRVIPVYLSLQKPYRGETLSDRKLKNTVAYRSRRKQWPEGWDVSDAWQEDSGFVGDVLRELGYDGIIVEGSNNIDGLEIVAFEPTQIKSATDNRGTFDPASPNIYEQPDESVFVLRDGSVPQTPEELEAMVAYRLSQEGARKKDPRGRIVINDATGQVVISLLKARNFSTFIHETGHFYLKIMEDLASLPDAPQDIRDDYATILNAIGAEPGKPITRESHELFARMFETYAMTGNAPSESLQTAFARFRAWLVGIYREIRRLNAPVSDEMRKVFDRMLATEDEIRAAEAIISQPIDLDLLSLPPERLAEHQKIRAEVRHRAEDALAAKLMAEYERERTRVWQLDREKVKAEVTAEINQEVTARAYSVLTKGTLPDGTPAPEGVAGLKIDRAAVVAEYPGLDWHTLPRGSTAKEGGMHPEAVAESFGFTSADEMFRALRETEPPSIRIESLTDERMQAENGDLLHSAELPVEAMKAVHSEYRSRLLRMELEDLAANHLPTLKGIVRKVARRIPTNAQVQEQARLIIASKRASEVNHLLYQRAEQKAAKAAIDAMLRGDFDAAFLEKQKELLNHELYRAAMAAREEVEQIKVEAAKLFQKDEKLAKGRDMDYVNAARAIAAAFGLGKTDKTADQYLAPISAYDPDTFNALKPLVDAATDGAVPYRTATVEQVRAMREAITSLWGLASEVHSHEVDGQKMARAEVLELLTARLYDLGLPANKRGYKAKVSDWQKTKLDLLGIDAALTRVESWIDAMDGGDPNGVFRRLIYTPVREAIDRYRVAKVDVAKEYAEIVKVLAPSLKGQTKKIEATEIGYTFENKAELLGAILHIGNESNLDKLIRGREWSGVQWDAFVQRMFREGVITKADMDYAQAVWDLFERLKPAAWKAHKAMYGYYPAEITATPVHTPFGTYRGGYVPARVDASVVNEAKTRADKEALENENNSFGFPSTGKGFTISRNQKYARPLLMDLKLVESHIDWVLRFTHIEPHTRSVARLVNNRQFREVLDAFDPVAVSEMLIPWLQRSARQTVSVAGFNRTLDRFFTHLRTNSGMGAMVGNVVNVVQQLTGFSISAVKVKPKYLRNALVRYTRNHRQVAADIAEKSDFMSTRLHTQVADLRSEVDGILLNPNAYETVREFARRHGYFLQASFQNVVDITTWVGAYDQAVANKATETEAVRQADSAVRMTQGSFNPEDVSRFEAGTPFMRLFSMFYSYFNMQANLLRSEFTIIARNKMGLKAGLGRGLYVYTFGFMTVAVLSRMIVDASKGELGDEDNDGYLDDVLATFFGAQWETATGFVPGVGQFARAVTNRLNDKWYDDRISVSPAIVTLESVKDAPVSLYKAVVEDGSKKKAVRDVLTALNLLSGVPVAFLSKPIGYGLDIQEGRAEPEGALDMARGFVTGRTGTR